MGQHETFYLLSDTIQKKVWDMKWGAFTPIQDKTIPVVMNTSKDVVVASGTASGKTEAVFLPILSQVEKTAPGELNVLYISPLKALINNQFERIEKLCEETYIPIHKWHGDVSASKKKKLIDYPEGILQITPESIESLFINRTRALRHLFINLKFIVIDEVHAFLDKERGVHLRSLLSRIEPFCREKPRMIGLSATIDNFELVKKWINHQQPENVEIIESKGNEKDLFYSVMHFDKGEQVQKPVELYEDIFDITQNHSSLIFCNSRGEVEEATVFLNRLSERKKLGEKYFAHHSSIDKKEREYVEKTMSESTKPKSVVATSTLELGIDIGDIDLVIQIDDTFTVSSLKQRLGRSGRKKGADQYLQVYTTSHDSLLQSTSVLQLLLEQWVEPAKGYALPFDILFHQMISTCHETNGIHKEELVDTIVNNASFHQLQKEDVAYIIDHMIQNEHLESVQGTGELIVGLEGERLLRGKEFYAVFQTPEEMEVLEGIRKIGTIDKTPFICEGDNIILSGKLWTMKTVDMDNNKIYVKPSVNATPPRYTSGGAEVHPKIIERMHDILCSNETYSFMDEIAQQYLQDMRQPYQEFNVQPDERIIWIEREGLLFESFTGTKIFTTLVWMLRSYGVNISKYDAVGRMVISDYHNLKDIFEDIIEKEWRLEDIIRFVDKDELFQSKYTPFLPKDIHINMHMAHRVDIEGVKDYLNRFRFREAHLR